MSRRAAFIRVSFSLLFMIALGGAVFVFGLFTAIDQLASPAYRVILGEQPEVTAKSWIVYDVELGDVLFSKNPDEVLPIASITKLPVAAVLYDQGLLEATTTITWSDLDTDGEAGRLSYGEVYSNRELLFPLLLESSNDAATTIARSNPDTLPYLNDYTAQLHLEHTHFADASGLSDENVSTARELMQLSRYLYQHYPYIIDITKLQAYYSSENGWLNNNPFESDEGYLGGKHGFTYAANRTATSFFEERIGEHKRVIGYIILGSDDLKADMAELRRMVARKTIFD